MKIVTKPGGTYAYPPKGKDAPIVTDEQIEAKCKTLNSKAQTLGLSTRYEVSE